MTLMKIQKIYHYQLLLVCFLSLHATSQIVMSGGARININGGTAGTPIFVVLDTPPATPITFGATDGIIMEAEYNRLQYNLGTGSTAITVPYMSTLLEQIPLVLTPSAAGTGAGNIRFSSIVAATRATGFDNNNYRPSDVTNMGALPGITNNSAKTIDRFWIIDANGYTTKPAVTLSFTYIDAEWAANGGNTITESNLRAQRFTTALNEWGGYVEYLPTGSINVATNVVSGVTVPSADFYRSWTLNDNSVPLPIELINFEANCLNKETVLEWCTASETDNDFFTVEQSIDGLNFQAIGTVNGNGTTTVKHCYKFTTGAGMANVNYYRLTQTDHSKKTTVHKIVSLNACDQLPDNTVITNNGTKTVGILVNSSVDATYELNVHNSLGQIVDVKQINVKKGYNTIQVNLDNVSNAIYYLSLLNGSEKPVTKKIVVSDFGY
jgi:hypothetical protein